MFEGEDNFSIIISQLMMRTKLIITGFEQDP